MNATDNRILFLRWARQTFPEAYQEAVTQALNATQPGTPATLSGLWESITSAFERVTTALPNLAQTYVTAKAQIDWLKLNAERAKKGEPPLDPVTGLPLQPQGVIAPPVNSQAAKIETQIATSAQGVPPWAWIAGAGVVAFLVLRGR